MFDYVFDKVNSACDRMVSKENKQCCDCEQTNRLVFADIQIIRGVCSIQHNCSIVKHAPNHICFMLHARTYFEHDSTCIGRPDNLPNATHTIQFFSSYPCLVWACVSDFWCVLQCTCVRSRLHCLCYACIFFCLLDVAMSILSWANTKNICYFLLRLSLKSYAEQHALSSLEKLHIYFDETCDWFWSDGAQFELSWTQYLWIIVWIIPLHSQGSPTQPKKI